MGRDTSSHWLYCCGCASFGLSACGEMEPMKMILKGQMWFGWNTTTHSVPRLTNKIHQLLEKLIQNRKDLFMFSCVFHSGCGEYNESLREAGFSQRKQPSMHERVFSSCPYCKPLTFPHCWLAFSRVQLYSREMPAVLHLDLCCRAADAPEESS